MQAGALLPARVESSLTRLGGRERQARIGELLNPTAARVSGRPVGTAAAQLDFFDRMGPALQRAVQTLIGQPPVQPTASGQVPRLPWEAPSGPPSPLDHSAELSARRPWESIGQSAQKTFDEAQGLLERMQDGGATSQAELLAIQMKFQKANQMFLIATNTMKAAHDARKAIISNLKA